MSKGARKHQAKLGPSISDVLRGALAVDPKGMPKAKDRKPRKKRK